MVAEGKVRREDKEGNDAADIAADFGRLRQPEAVIDARRNLLRVKKEWYSRVLSLHRFMVAIARESLNIGDSNGSVIDPLCWDRGSRSKVRRVDERVLVELAQLPGPPGFLDHEWVSLDSCPLTDVDISLWPYSVPMLVKFTCFLSTLDWPEGLNEMGKFGVSYLEVFILFERWIGHRLLPEKTVPSKNRLGRVLHVGTDGVQIRLGCQFIGSLFRSLGKLPGGLGRFIPGSLGPHLSRLRHLGWLQCGHGLTCRPLESSLPGCLEPLLHLLGYPAGAVDALSNGFLRIRYCTHSFARRLLPWGFGNDSISSEVIHFRIGHCSLGDVGHHSLPEEVNDGPKVVRRRIRGKNSRSCGCWQGG